MRKLKRRKLNKILIPYVHGRNTRKPNSSPKWPKTSPKIPLQLKTKQGVAIVFLVYKKEEGNSQGDRKQIFGKQIYAGSGRDNDL